MTFHWHVWNSLTFPGFPVFPDKWSPCLHHFYRLPVITIRLSCMIMEIWTLNYMQVTYLNFRGWCDVIGCVTVGPRMCDFLYVVSNNHMPILHSYGDNEPQRYCGSDLDNAGHVTLPVTWPFDSPWGFPIGGQWSPCVYLALLVRYKASKQH